MKKLTQVFAVAAVAMTTVGMTGSAFAAETDSKDSTASVEFKTPETGALTLKEVPNFDFGTHEISTDDQVYSNTTEGKAQVQDIRGTVSGWSVSVLQNDDFKQGSTVLDGAQMKIASPAADNGTTSDAATLAKGTAVEVWNAAKGTGNYLSNLTFDGTEGQATLDVPGASEKITGSYTTTLTWTLSDGVSQ